MLLPVCPSQRLFCGTPASACSTWLPQPVQVALPHVGQVAGEHIVVTFLVIFLETITYPRGYRKADAERCEANLLAPSADASVTFCTLAFASRCECRGLSLCSETEERAGMWDRARRSGREAREFASLHALMFHADAAPELPRSASVHPFQHDQRRECVSGEWRGRTVQRFSTPHLTVELMTLPGILPRLQVVPVGLEREALAVGSRAVPTGDVVFDSRWTVLSDNVDFATSFLSPRIREALLHPSAAGRSLVVDGAAVYLWAKGDQPWTDTRVRFEFLSVISGRIETDVWTRFDATPPVMSHREPSTVFLPGADAALEVNHWRIAPVPVGDDEAGAFGDTAEFEVALLHAELDGVAFIPGPDEEVKAYESWRMAPDLRR